MFWIGASVIEELRSDEAASASIPQPLGNDLIEALTANDVPRSRRGLEACPRSLDATLLYGALLRRQKQFTEAENVLKAAPQTWPEQANLFLEAALVKLGLTQPLEADVLLTPVLNAGERQWERYLSNALLDMGRFEESEVYFGRATALHVDQYDYFRRACRYALLGEADRAFEYLDKAVSAGHTAKPDYEQNPALQFLKTDARWKALAERLK